MCPIKNRMRKGWTETGGDRPFLMGLVIQIRMRSVMLKTKLDGDVES